MKKINKKIYLTTLGLSSAFVFTSLMGQSLAPSFVEKVQHNIENTNIVPQDFQFDKIKNNLISNEGSPNYQYQNLVSSEDVNNPELYNRKSVLSSSSIQTVRNEKYYFNFIQSSPEQPYHIMITPTDSALAPDLSLPEEVAKYKFTTEYTKMNGSAFWTNDRLIIIGSKGEQVLLSSYSQNMETGELTLEDTLQSELLNSLQNQTEKLINSWPYVRVPVPSLYSYNTFTNPIYMSPIENFSPSKKDGVEFLVWSADYTLDQLQTGQASPSPIRLSYNLTNGFEIKESFRLELSPTLTYPIDPKSKERYTQAQYLSSRILALTPVIEKNGNFSIYVHSFGGADITVEGYLFISKISVTNTKMEIVEIIENPIEVESRHLPNSSNNNSLRDPMNYLPYGLLVYGDQVKPNDSSSILNLFWYVSSNAITNSIGVATNIIIKSEPDNFGLYMAAPSSMQLRLFEDFGLIYRNYLVTLQMYYPPERDLNKGIKIGIRFLGIGSNNWITRAGYFNWRQPWNSSLWNQDAAIYGTTIVDGYGASKYSTYYVVPGYANDPRYLSQNTFNTPSIDEINFQVFLVDVAPTVWNGIYSAPGIYDAQRRLPNPQTGALPTEPANRKGVQINSRNLNLSSSKNTTDFNTEIPFNISLSPEQYPDLSPTFLGLPEITKIISERSNDFPAGFQDLIISNLEFINGNSLLLNGELMNPYINGVQLLDNETLPFNLKIQHIPTQEEIENPVKINFNKLKNGYPSILETPINEAFGKDRLPFEITDIIGTSSSNFVQVLPSISPFVSKFVANSNDFLGYLEIEYEITTLDGKTINNQIKINGFWGYVYIIPIVLGSVIIIGLTILLILFLLKRKHKKDLSLSISKGFNLYQLNENKAKGPKSKIGSKFAKSPPKTIKPTLPPGAKSLPPNPGSPPPKRITR